MSFEPGPREVQRALDFLSGLEAARIDWSRLPPWPDYAAVARLAGDVGIELSEGAVREAFRVMMQARSLAAGPRREGRGRP